MKTGSMIVAVAMVIVVMSGSTLPGARAQVDCLDNAGAGAPFSDATTVVDQLLTTAGPCCQSSGGFCTVLATSGNAAGTICSNSNACPNCVDVGTALNQILAQCNQLNFVQGVSSPDGGQTLYYLTSDSNHPN